MQLIPNIDQVQYIQTEINNIYIKFCTLYHEEMNSWLRSNNVHRATHKCFKRCTKPFWNNHLTHLWNILSENEKQYVQYKNNQQRKLRHEFQEAQNIFDQNYRKTERNYRKSTIIEIETSPVQIQIISEIALKNLDLIKERICQWKYMIMIIIIN